MLSKIWKVCTKLFGVKHDERYHNVVFVRQKEGLRTFLKCSLLEPVTGYNPAPAWTTNISEAELLSGDRNQLCQMANLLNSVPIYKYGTAEEVRL